MHFLFILSPFRTYIVLYYTILADMQAHPVFKFMGLVSHGLIYLNLKIKIENNTFHFSDLSFLSISSKIHLPKANLNPIFFKPIGLYWKVLHAFFYKQRCFLISLSVAYFLADFSLVCCLGVACF